MMWSHEVFNFFEVRDNLTLATLIPRENYSKLVKRVGKPPWKGRPSVLLSCYPQVFCTYCFDLIPMRFLWYVVTANNLSTFDNMFKKNSKDLFNNFPVPVCTSDVVYGFEKLLDCAPWQLSDLLQWYHSPRRGSISESHVCHHFQPHLGRRYPATLA